MMKMQLVKVKNNERKGMNASKDSTPIHTYWFIKEEDCIGIVRIQPKLHTAMEENFIGNIGFEITPIYRNKGYGKLILGEGLKKCRELNLKRALVICSEKNIACQKIITYHEGKLEDAHYDFVTQSMMKRYWIDIKERI